MLLKRHIWNRQKAKTAIIRTSQMLKNMNSFIGGHSDLGEVLNFELAFTQYSTLSPIQLRDSGRFALHFPRFL